MYTNSPSNLNHVAELSRHVNCAIAYTMHQFVAEEPVNILRAPRFSNVFLMNDYDSFR